MKKLIIIFLTFLFSSFVFADDGGYKIKNFDIQMNINIDGSADVKETMYINFSDYRHGIYRTIPVLSEQGYRHIENFSAGSDPIASNSITNGFYQLKIGNKNSTLIGEHIYHINYKILNAIKQYSGSQELSWNIVGTDWQTTIDKSSFKITFPKDYELTGENLKLFYGKKGERNQDNFYTHILNNSIEGNFSQQLLATQGINIAIRFPNNFFSLKNNDYLFDKKISDSFSASDKQQMLNYILNLAGKFMWIIFVGPWFFIIISPFVIKNKILSSKPKWHIKTPILVQYTPPNINPYHAFLLRYENYNSHLFGAIFYYWLTKKYITLEHIGSKYALKYQINNLDYMSLDKILLSSFFDDGHEKFLDSNLSSECERLFKLIKSDIKEKANFLQEGFGSDKLTNEGDKIIQHMAGFREFFEKVDKNVIETNLKSDPDYVSNLLPWAVLFGVNTKFLQIAQPYLLKTDWYDPEIDLNTSYNHFSNSYYQSNMFANSSSSYSGSYRDSGSSFSSSSSGSSSSGGGGGGGGSW